MDFSSRAPIASPDDDRVSPHSSSPSLFASSCGHFLGFGFLGQFLFTFLQWNVVANTHGRAEAGHSMTVQLMLLGVPLVFALLGVWSARNDPFNWLANVGAITLFGLAGMLLALFNLFLWVLTGFSGYC